MTEKAKPPAGLWGWDSTNEVWVRILVDSTGKITVTSTDLTTILSEIQHATYGLSAIETLIDEVESLLKHGTYGLSALETLVDGVETDLTAMKQKDTSPAFDSDTDSLEAISEAIATHDTAIKADLGDFSGQTNLQTLLAALGIPDVSAKPLYTCLVTDRLDNVTYGLSALKNSLIAIDTVVDNIVADTGIDIVADFDRHLTPLDFWGDPIATVQISTSSNTKSLGTITVPTLPTGATIWKVQLIGYISYVVDTSGSDNAINGGVYIQVQDDGGGSWKTGYDLQDNALMVDVSQSKVSPGIPIVGNLNNDDLGGSGYVDGPDTYNVQITAVTSDGDNLDLYGLQFGLRIWVY